MPKVIDGELTLSTRTNAGFGDGHHSSAVDQQVDRAAFGQESVGEATNAGQVTEVEFAHFDTRDITNGYAGLRYSSSTDPHISTCLGQCTGRFQPEPRVATCDDCEPPGEVDTFQDVPGGTPLAETGLDILVRYVYEPRLGSRALSRSTHVGIGGKASSHRSARQIHRPKIDSTATNSTNRARSLGRLLAPTIV